MLGGSESNYEKGFARNVTVQNKLTCKGRAAARGARQRDERAVRQRDRGDRPLLRRPRCPANGEEGRNSGGQRLAGANRLISSNMLGGASQTVSKIRVECNGT